jgi:hypothetical protein
VNRSTGAHTGQTAALVGMAAAMLLLAAAPAPAAVYPAGGASFSGGPQGWQATEAGCDAEPICTASGGYDGGDGNPPGSIAASTTTALNLLTVFESNVTLQSPDFTVAGGRSGTLHLERQFAPGSLVDVAAETYYEVTLIDRTAGRESQPLDEAIENPSGFTGKDAAVTVVPGHTYAISIAVQTSSSVAGTGLFGGTTSTRFDNVGLVVPASAGTDGDGDRRRGAGGAGALTNRRLLATIQGSLVGPATLRGGRLFVKARCPAPVGRACRVSLQGLLRKRSAATARRVVKIAKGKSRRVVLAVKPKARGKVTLRKRLLFKQTVKAGPARATVYRRLKLIHR